MADELAGVLMIVVAVATLPLGILAALFLGWKAAVVVFVVGWLLLTPLLPILGGLRTQLAGTSTDEASEESSAEAGDPLAELKQRYARGEMSDEEFERRIGNLVETEDLDIESDADRDGLDERDGFDARDLERARE